MVSVAKLNDSSYPLEVSVVETFLQGGYPDEVVDRCVRYGVVELGDAAQA
jgi:hypothetical protein